jgi:hypothetical protein
MKVQVTFEVELPKVEHTEDQLEEFIRFEYGDNGVLSGDNPFNKRGIRVKPTFGTFDWEYIDVK